MKLNAIPPKILNKNSGVHVGINRVIRPITNDVTARTRKILVNFLLILKLFFLFILIFIIRYFF